MSLFRKKQEVFINPSKKKGKRLLPDTSPEGLSKHFGNGADQDTEDDLYPLPLPAEEPEELTQQKKKQKKVKSPKEKKQLSGKPPFYRSKLFIGSACIVVASLISFVLVPVMSYVTTTEMTTVVKVSNAVSKGTRLEAAMLQTVSVPALNVSGDTLRQANPAIGLYAAVDLVQGDLLMQTKLSSVMPFPDDYLYSIPTGQQAISIAIQSFAGGLSGKLQAGDIVSVYAVPNQTNAEDDDYHAILPPELTYVRVLAVTNKLSMDKSETLSAGAAKKDGSEGMDEEQQPVTVTLLVNSQQAAAVAGLNVNAQVHMALVSRGNEADALGLLQSQEEFFLEDVLTESSTPVEETTEITEPVDTESVVSAVE